MVDERRDALTAAGKRHHINVVKVWQRLGGEWCIQLFQEVNPYPDGSGHYITARWHDLETMYQDLIRYFKFNEEVDTMNIFGTNLFKYMAGEMLLDKNGRPIVVKMTIKDVWMEDISNAKSKDEKPMVSFEEREKYLVLNKTNARAIATQYGGETEDWRGKQIAMTAEHGAWFGTKGVRVVVLDHLPANGNGKAKPEDKNGEPSPPPPVDEDAVPWTDGI